MSKNYIPMNGSILIKPISAESVSGGLIIPDTSSNIKKGRVVSVGEDQPLCIGQQVLVKSGTGEKIILDGESYLLFSIRDIWLKVEEDVR